MSPRPILKQFSDSPDYPIFPFSKTSIPTSASSSNSSIPRVHFPPTPKLCQTYLTYSVKAYDRAPIVVAPNDCELPERGCPGRTYGASDDGVDRAYDYFQTKGCEGPATIGDGRPSMQRMPPLVADMSSSDSEDSDDLLSPPNEALSAPYYNEQPVTLAFLPHAPIQSKRRESKRLSPCGYEDQFKTTDATSTFVASALDGCLGGF